MSAAKGWSGSCPGGWLEFGGSSGGVRDLVQDAANWGWSWTTFGLKAENEGDSNSWKRLTDDAYLRVYYNLPPRQTPMSQLTMSPGSVCSSTGVGINNWPQISATASDPDGEAIGVQFAVAWDDGSTGYKRRWWSTGAEAATPASNSFKGSGSLFSVSLPALPASAGGSYGWEMRAWDGASWGPWSSDGDPTVCYFGVDTSRPEGPKITSSSYPGSTDAAATLPWTDGVGQYGEFTMSSTNTDVVKYQWGLDTSASAAHEVATTGGAPRTVKMLPETPGVHVLAAQAVDGAGNVSESQSYYFNVLNGRSQRAGWGLDEATGGSFAGTGGNVAMAPHPGATVGVPGRQGNAVAFNGTADGYAGTESAVLDTDRSFTVSVWANLADVNLTRTAVSQAAGNTAFFDLGERDGKWAFVTYTADLADGFGWQPAVGTVPVALNTWTHLTGVYDAAAMKVLLYVDGTLAAQAPAPKSFASRGPLELGRFRYMGGYVDPWKGSLDELKVWDRALSAGEVADSAADRPLTSGVPAKAVWHFDETTGPMAGFPESDSLSATGVVQAGVSGTAGKAVNFDGKTGYARTSRPQVDGTRSFSVSTWARLPQPAAG
ncbi:LamG domain-containing protein, partial [Kitasatospora sp. NPDC049258]|uniref:LamG domain-containing protein n=1 Tax=Kitasatospora sp. NPDC049258 TaxID=3155394 RepID=UPI003431F7BB